MAVRTRVWSIGLAGIGVLFSALWWGESSRELSLPVALVATSLVALVAEVLTLRSLAHHAWPPDVPPKARPADGVVEIVEVAGIEGEPCRLDPRFLQFVGLLPIDPEKPVRPIASSRLLGQVALISVFVGRDGTRWSDLEISGSLQAVERSGAWVEREALRYEARVNVGLADVFFVADDDSTDLVEVAFWQEGNAVGPMEAHAATKAVVMATRAAASRGFVDVADWMCRINARVEADACAWLFHVRGRGRSHAILAGSSGLPGVGFAVCFAGESSFPEPLAGKVRFDSSTIAHELLHLFGATDKYGVALRTFPRGSVSSREIMRLNHDSLSRMTIDRLTALEIGWNQQKRPSPPG